MKPIKIPFVPRSFRRLALALGAAALAAPVAMASPYATSLTNNAGTVSFRLNQTTATNDTVLVISSGGTITNTLQAPSANPANFITRGLIITNLGIAAGTFQVEIKHLGSGVIATNSQTVAMGAVRGIAANVNPASPYFGWVYVSDSATNSASRGDGIFVFSSDLTDITGQGLVPRNGGYTGFGSSTTFSPYKISVAPDDSVLVCDDSDPTANLISMPPLLTSFSYVLKPIETSTNNPAISKGAAPVGSNNVHGSVASAVIVGTGASRVLYTMDEDYQRDPTSGASTEWNSVWRYDIGNNPLPWSNAPNRIVASPFLTGFAGQNQGIQYHQFGSKHYLYFNQRRSNPPQHDVYVVDLDNLPDPSTYGGATTPYAGSALLWTSQDESIAEGYSDDVLRDMNQITVSPDGRWLAGIIAAGSANITAPDGSTFATAANDIIVIPITNGIPNLPARQTFKFNGLGNGRDLAFDAANNLICGSSGLGYIQSLDIGESTDATTGSDGTFTMGTPATQVSVSASTPVAREQGSVPGVITFTRTPEDVGNPLTVFYTITGTATNVTDYAISGGTATSVVIPAGQTSANVTFTPVDDTIPELTETIILSVKGSGGYSVGFPNAATVVIADNETPQLRIVSLSTNIYQGITNDYASLSLQRLGDTNVAVVLDANSFGIGGTAVSNVDYYLAAFPITIPAGTVNFTTPLIYPGLNGSTAIGSLSIVVTNLAGAGYTVTNNTATTFLQLKALPAGTVLFSDDFETDSSANYNLIFASYTNNVPDYNVIFGYDYTSGSVGNLSPIPPAPHSASGATKGLYMTVNKNDSYAISAGLNLYLKNHVFSNNYALRFDMFLVRNSSSTAQSKTEAAMFGINHDGTHTNWFRNAQTGTDLPPAPATLSDGLWFDVGGDGSSGSGSEDFGFWSSPTYTNTAGVIGPTNFILLRADAFTQVYKNPPYDGGVGTGAKVGGAPANTVVSPTPTWAEVEVSQIGNRITWKINNSVVGTFLNTNLVSFNPAIASNFYTNGTIMLGYDDPWDDIGNSTAGSGEACVIYDNVRVVTISPPVIITQPSSIVAPAGTLTNLSVVASTGTGVTNYQWLKSGTNVVGATNATLNFPALSLADYGTYSVRVDDGSYPTTSASVTVLPPTPVINTQPVSRASIFGNTISPAFSVVASTFSGRTNYQWYTNTPTGVIVNRTNATLSLTNLVAANFRPYFVTVSDGISVTLTSSVVQLTVAAAQPITESVSGSTLSLSFGSEFGPSYVVEYKTNLTDATWKPLITNVGTGSPITVTDSLIAAPTRFYRTRVQ